MNNKDDSFSRFIRSLEKNDEENKNSSRIDAIQEALKSSNEELLFLKNIILFANRAELPEELYSEIIKYTLEYFTFTICGIYIIDWNEKVANLVYHKNLTSEILKRYEKIDINADPWKRIQKKNVIIHDKYITKEGGEKINIPIITGISIPFMDREKLIGFMNLASFEKINIAESKINVLSSMGRNIGSTIRRVLLENELKKANIKLEMEILEKQEIEKELKEKQDHYLNIFDSIVDPLFVIDDNLRILSHNEALRKWNKSINISDCLIGKNVLQVYPMLPKMAIDQFKLFFRDNITEVEVNESKFSVNGKTIVQEIRQIPIIRNKIVIQMIIVLRDITARKLSENALKLSEEKFSVLFHSSPLAILLFRYSDSKLLDINETALQMWGYRKEELLNKSADELTLTKEYLKDIGAEQLAKYGNFRNYQSQIITKDGKTLIGSFSAEMVEIGGNYCVFHVIEDITERINQEIQINKNKRLAALGQLSAGVAHQLNTPLANIILTTDYIKKTLEKDKELSNSQDFIQELTDINKQVDYCSNIIKKLLLFSRKLSITKMKVNIRNIFEELLAFPAIESEISKNNIIACLEIKEGLTVEGDKTLLKQVFQNVLENAIDALRMKTINIEDRSKQKRDITISSSISKKEIKITITDNGIGIDDDSLAKLFEPFFTTKEVGKGSGLGLSISKGIIDEHNGKIIINSNNGIGTDVHVFLPKV